MLMVGLDPFIVAAARPVEDGKFGNVTIFDRTVLARGSVIALAKGFGRPFCVT